MKHQNGLTVIELSLIVTLFLAMTLITLSSMTEISSRTERAQFERTVQHIQNTLDIVFSKKHQDDLFSSFFANINQVNPIVFLKRPPANYLGSYENIKSHQVAAGHWYFDQSKSQLVYIPKYPQLITGKDSVLSQITFQIKGEYQDINHNQQFDKGVDVATGFSLKSSNPYHWVPEKASLNW